MNYIFDFGANKGQNLNYFLSRADRVVAIEAVPEFCSYIESRFAQEIANDRLKVINAFASNTLKNNSAITFFQSPNRPGESTFLSKGDPKDWIELTIPSISASSLIHSNMNRDDKLLYVKIDVEGADELVITSLKDANLIPSFLSVEIHNINVVKSVLEWGVFNDFQIVEAGHPNRGWLSRILINLPNYDLKKDRLNRVWWFSPITSGPFGSDLPRYWLPVSWVMDVCTWFGLGARDLHFAIQAPQKKRRTVPLSYLSRRVNNRIILALLPAKIRIVTILKLMLGKKIYGIARGFLFMFRPILPSKIRRKILLISFRRF